MMQLLMQCIFYVMYGWYGYIWQSDLFLVVEGDGYLVLVVCDGIGEVFGCWVLLGMLNLYLYVFQCVMVGLVEWCGLGNDSFWIWCEVMYCFVVVFDLELLQVIVVQFYVEMFKVGYMQVCEFYYVYYQGDGMLYVQCEVMLLVLIEVVKEVGIVFILLLVLYMIGGFDGCVFNECQCCFGYVEVFDYVCLFEMLCVYELFDLCVGIVLYLLCVVLEVVMCMLLVIGVVQVGFIYIYIVEQLGEVQDCFVVCGVWLVEWLFDYVEVDMCWCLVYVIYFIGYEILWFVCSGVVVGLCLIIEVNLGDGLFLLVDYFDVGGMFGIGFDLYILVLLVEELCWLEYGQWLVICYCNIVVCGEGESVGEMLWIVVLYGGVQVVGLLIGVLEVGQCVDMLVLDDDVFLFVVCDVILVMDSFLFVGNMLLVCYVMCGGCWVVCDFCYYDEVCIGMCY